LRRWAVQITEFLEKKRTEFTLPIDCQGTPFQKDVWNYLKNIPYGKTLSYSEMAQKMNIPTSTRAIAKALSQNPLCLLLPCHRIIGKSGKLTGYAGGIVAKKYLLSLEQNS